MSKNKKSKVHSNVSVRKTNRKRITVFVVTLAVIAVIAVVIVLKCSVPNNKDDLCKYSWRPFYAENASGDEVDMSEVYNTKYTNYQGSLEFKKDGTFTFWLTPGVEDDGSHTGTYEIKDDNTILAGFDNGTQTEFKLSDGAIIVNYEDYKVKFVKNNLDNDY